jgi:hypothetical protein
MKVALLFFGITRSLKYTIYSIQTNILNVFNKSNIQYDIYLHTLSLYNYTNVRTKEHFTTVDNEEYKLLNATYVRVENQTEIKNKLNLIKYKTHDDPWNTNYNSVDNFILAQYSKSQLVDMLEKTNKEYDYIIYLRPDVLYIQELSPRLLACAVNNQVCVPNFHLFGKYKINDRFCITTMKTFKIYGNIFLQLFEISKNQQLHSETIIGEVLSKNNIKIKRISFLFQRIRMNGENVDVDAKIDKPLTNLFSSN